MIMYQCVNTSVNLAAACSVQFCSAVTVNIDSLHRLFLFILCIVVYCCCI